MAKYLVVRFGAGKYPVNSIVELSSGEAALYESKVRKIEEQPEPESEPKLEVATPKRSRRKKAQ
jgi:hypothetical protein